MTKTRKRSVRLTSNLEDYPIKDRLAIVVQSLVQRTNNSRRCLGCWFVPENCACQQWSEVQAQTQVVIHIHHCEWGISGNTAICIHRTLLGSQFLLRGIPEDDQKMNTVWDNKQDVVCVLWPGDDAISVDDLKGKLSTDSKLILVVPDGTFSAARRMVKKYPKHCIKVSLSSKSVLGERVNSLLHPVRKYGGSELETGRVSTLEAVAAFMQEIGEDVSVSHCLTENMKIQMNLALKQKQRPMIYETAIAPPQKE